MTINDKEETTHIEVQYILSKYGSDLGYDVWVANTDKNKSYNGKSFNDIKKILKIFPHIYPDDVSNKIVENIDVLWLKNNFVVCAFEIEHTTAIYSGLLRLSDLMCRNFDIQINPVIVYPPEREQKIIEQINRPVFREFDMLNKCRILSYTELNTLIKNTDITIVEPKKLISKFRRAQNLNYDDFIPKIDDYKDKPIKSDKNVISEKIVDNNPKIYRLNIPNEFICEEDIGNVFTRKFHTFLSTKEKFEDISSNTKNNRYYQKTKFFRSFKITNSVYGWTGNQGKDDIKKIVNELLSLYGYKCKEYTFFIENKDVSQRCRKNKKSLF